MGIFQGSGLKDGKVFERGVYLGVGKFRLEIQQCLVNKSRKGKSGFIVEFIVKETSDPAKHAIGSKASWYQDMTADGAWGAMKEFAYATLGLNYADPADKAKCITEVDPVIEKLFDDALDNGALNKKIVDVQTSIKKTVAKGLDFTVHMWSPAR